MLRTPAPQRACNSNKHGTWACVSMDTDKARRRYKRDHTCENKEPREIGSPCFSGTNNGEPRRELNACPCMR
eukprot:scaffold1996_cov132-Isochrysis_galbana.AAC.6